MASSRMILWICIVLAVPIVSESGKVLVIPQNADVWLDMLPMVDKLKLKGNEIVVVIPRSSFNLVSSENLIVKMYSAPLVTSGLITDMDITKEEPLMNSLLCGISTVYRHLKYTASVLSNTCQHLMADTDLLQYLHNMSFNVAVMDPWFPCGPILAKNLSVPAIYVLPGIACDWDNKATCCPRTQHFNLDCDQTDLVPRIKCFLVQVLEHIACQQINAEYTSLASHFLHKDVNMLEIFSQAELWMFKYDFVLHSAEPVMPKMIFIGGDSCAEKQPVPRVSNDG
ncbi:UDP-glucuronosyltransferase 1A1-like [Spea bombifrons]|uniref:UDP-glucuronosyltransferase 1A1-like n=1 Tax=Spea bombifrons TaxID=233779 RepID=UPI00234ADEF6|nr:UDP-glucuronosyltransferase 1A1-like [Spea bombifrons]